MTPSRTTAFQPTRPVTGAEAIDAVEKLEALAESAEAMTSRRRIS